jgi:NADH-quinone oxidoreductase subunit G
MTRCIHCTRCIRFAQDIAGVPELGAIGRGEHMEITTYLDKALASELSANVIDLCPVGALTSKPYAFKSRPWELTHTESVDVMDAVGSNIRIDTRGREVMRVLPRLNEDINEEWISDKTRYAIDGLKTQRLDKPMIRRNGRLEPCSWEEALGAVAEKMRSIPGDKMAAIAGDLCDAESMASLLGLMQSLGSPHSDCRQDGAALDASAPASYRFNTTIAGIEEADVCLVIGGNPRTEAPIINARLRKRYLRGGLTVASLGAPIDLTFPVQDLGNTPALLTEIAAGTHPFAKTLQNAKRPMLILGMDALKGEDGANVLGAARAIAESCGLIQEGWNGFNVLHTAAARVGGLAMDFVPGKKGMNVNAMLKAAQKGTLELVYLLGADEIDVEALGDAFVVYQGHHGDRGAHRADVIFPGAAYTEKNGLYVNTEGRVQEGFRAVFPPGEAREDWKIIRALSEAVGKTLPFDDLASLRQQLVAEVPLFATRDVVLPAAWGNFGATGAISRKKFDAAIANFYMTNALCRASRTMAECTRTFITPEQKAA